MPLSSSQDQDARFAVFLNPIRDLTKNWEVDIAKYLEKYLEELAEVQITFDGGETMMNFAEAAMLIQGSATVYSKKVDFLWQMVLQMLELLSSKKKFANVETETGDEEGPSSRRKGASADLTMDFQKNDNLSDGRNIELKEEDEDDTKGKPFTLLPATPIHLIEKEAEKSKNKINLYLSNMETFGGKDDFRLNRLYMTPSGLLCLDLPPELLRQDSFPQSPPTRQCMQNNEEIEKNVDPPVSPDLALSPLEEEVPDDCADEVDYNLEPMPLLEPLLDAEQEQKVEEQHVAQPDEQNDEALVEVSKTRLRKRGGAAEALAQAPLEIVDPLKPMDPHEQSSPPRPVRAGRIRKPPPCSCHRTPPQRTRKRKNAASNASPDNNESNYAKLLPIDEHILKRLPDLVNNNTKPSATTFDSTREKIHPALRDQILIEEGRRCEEKKQKEAQNALDDGACQTLEEALVVQEERELQRRNVAVDGEDNNNLADDNDAGGDDFLEGPDDEQLFEMPDPHAGAIVDDESGGTNSKKHNTTATNLNDTLQYEPDGEYEALVQKWVADYIVNSHEYIASSDLTRRVNRWRTKIAPVLSAEEDRLNFDIHSYGSKILEKFGDDVGEVVSFQEVVSGLPKNEVARVFLSTLMLSNTYNVQPVLESNKEMPMDCLSLKLLSRVRHHEEMDEYMAPSQNANVPVAHAQRILGSPDHRNQQRKTKNAAKVKGSGRARRPVTPPSSDTSDSSDDEVLPQSSNRQVASSSSGSSSSGGSSSGPSIAGVTPSPPSSVDGSKVNGIIEGLGKLRNNGIFTDITEECSQQHKKRARHAAAVDDR